MLSRLSLPSFFSRRDWRDDLSAYLDNELTPRERERIEARLAQSEEMREYLADLQDMRSVLRGFSPAPSAAPFQLTAEILERDTRTPLSASGATRALRMSMATAAVGVAAFAAVMVFDVIDSPTVTFTTTQAGDMSTQRAHGPGRDGGSRAAVAARRAICLGGGHCRLVFVGASGWRRSGGGRGRRAGTGAGARGRAGGGGGRGGARIRAGAGRARV